MSSSRSTRNQPFCWQEKKVLRLLRKYFEGAELQKLRNLYLTITEMDSDFNGEDIKFYTKTVSTYSGLSKDWIPKGLKVFEELKMIEIVEDRENGKFKGKRLVFTPENIEEIPLKTVHGKSSNGKSTNGNLESSEDISLLEDNSLKEDILSSSSTDDKYKKFNEELQTFKTELSMMIREKKFKITPEELLKISGGDFEIIKRQFKNFSDKGLRYVISAIKNKYDNPKPKKEIIKTEIKPEITDYKTEVQSGFEL